MKLKGTKDQKEILMTPFLLHSTLEIKLGEFHPLLIHFPIVLFTAALICDLLAAWGKKGAFYTGHWMVFIGTLMCAPTILSGIYAADQFDPNNALVHTHKLLGYWTGAAGVIYSCLRIAAIAQKFIFPQSIYVGLSVILVALISWTGDYGGLITRGVTPFSSVSEPSNNPLVAKDKPEVQQFSPPQLETFLKQNIGVSDVIPIFAKHRCFLCHTDNFSGGQPHNFSKGDDPSFIFLPRNPDGTLNDYSNSAFYQTVILKNLMPKNEANESIGLSVGERLILQQWVQNGAKD